MFSLEVQIRNLTPTETIPNLTSQPLQQNPITIRFGPLQTDINVSLSQNINNQYSHHKLYSGGKRLLLDMQKNQIQNLLSTYAFGLFMQNRCGRFWVILSLEKVCIGDNYVCDGLIFYNDQRQSCYSFQLGVKLVQYNPKLPKNANAEPIPPLPTQNQKDKKIKSFLYGKKNSQVIQTLQPPQPVAQKFQRNRIQQAQIQLQNNKNSMNKKTKNTYTYAVAEHKPINNNFMGPQSDDQAGIYIPPSMQFVNNQHQNQNINVRQIPQKSPQKQPLPKDNINTFYNNRNNNQPPSLDKKLLSKTLPKFQTFDDYSQFRQHNQKLNKNIPKPEKPQKNLTRQQLRQLARKQAQTQHKQKQTQIMIPVPNQQTGTYQLIPLSKLSQAQILQYAHKQKMAEQYKKHQQAQKIKQKKKQQKKKKREQDMKIGKDMIQGIKKQNIGAQTKKNIKERISQKNNQSSQSQSEEEQKYQNKRKQQRKQQHKPHPKIPQNQVDNEQNSNQQQNSEERDEFHNLHQNQKQQVEQNYQQDYQSDFQSISNAGSLMKSRKSLQSSISMSQSHQKQKPKDKDKDIQQDKYKTKYNEKDIQKQSKYNEINDKYQYYLNKNNNKRNSDLQISQSMDDYGYSQDFDSFSQSVLSKNKRGSSISQISGDYGYIPNINYGSGSHSKRG